MTTDTDGASLSLELDSDGSLAVWSLTNETRFTEELYTSRDLAMRAAAARLEEYRTSLDPDEEHPFASEITWTREPHPRLPQRARDLLAISGGQFVDVGRYSDRLDWYFVVNSRTVARHLP